MEDRYSNPDDDARGPWTSGDLSARNYYGEGTYAVTCPSGRVIDGPPPGRYWAVSKAKFAELNDDGRIWWGEDRNNMPRFKRFLPDVKEGRVPQTLWTRKEVGHTQEAKKELLEVLPVTNSGDVFETPKPTRLIRRILELATEKSTKDVVFDFFAGSGTTGESVVALNTVDGGDRRYVCVQLPSALDSPAKLRDNTILATIAEITKERLRRAGKKIRVENPLFRGDLGFRVFKLASSNIREWEPDRANLAATLVEHAEHLRTDRTEADILFELLLKLGLDLTMPIEEKKIAGKTVHSVGAGTLLVCLTEKISAKEVEPLALGIAEWHKVQNPSGESTIVFRDSAFADDVAKTNLTATLQQHGLGNVRSL